MKSITKKISLLLILSAVLFLSSCLDSGSPSYIGKQEPSYITQGLTTGTIYARTQAGYYITSPKIKQLTPGTIALLSYQVKTEEDEKVTVDENVVAYMVELGAEPKTLDQTILQLSTPPEVTTPKKFESLMEPLFASNIYFGDRWIFPYTYKIKKGESVKVNFYKASNEDAKTANSDALIDVRLERLGTAEAGAAEKLEGDNIVVDFSQLRMMLADKADSQGKVSIKFRYYRLDNEDLYLSDKSYTMLIDKK